MTTLRFVGALVFVLLGAPLAVAQEQATDRVSAETVASVSMFSSWSQPSVILDGTATVRMGEKTIGLVRPWVWQRPDGSWTAEWYQLQVRYESGTQLPFRIDAGIIPSPLGLGTLEMRPDLNPTIAPPFYYVVPLPRFDQTFDALQVISGGYPVGAIVSTSGAHWDARAGVTSSTPARSRAELKDGQPAAMPQLIVGGGVSPIPGLRLGGGFGHGRYRDPRTTSVTIQSDYVGPDQPTQVISLPPADATVANVEAEYAFGHTRLKGEWVWDRFETTSTPVTASGFFVQAAQTFTPRWFGSARLTSARAPALVNGLDDHFRGTVAEAIAGYRLTREVTVRAGYYAERHYGVTSWDQQACASIVWSRLWR
jgi:hypothetical protein